MAITTVHAEQHSIMIVENLSHKNYFIWQIKIENLLLRNDLLNVIIGAESQLEDDDELVANKICKSNV